MTNEPLRVVTFNFLPFAYNMLARWIHETNNKHVLAVTTPGPTTRPTPSYKEIVTNAPRDVDILVTTRLRNVATPLIRELKPDLILCMTFPYRLTPEIIGIPRIGAVNLHPAVLPAYRGPNVFRAVYDGWHELGVTVHWMDAEFDTGNILSQRSIPMPDVFVPSEVLPQWMGGGYEALCEGVERAIAGEAGTKQDDSQASYAAPFTDEERWLDFNEPRNIVYRKGIALNIYPGSYAKINIDGEPYRIMGLELSDIHDASAKSGQCLAREEGVAVIQASDGALRLQVQPLTEQ